MPSSCLQKLLLSVAVAFLALPLHVTAEEVLRYVGKAEISTPVGYSCYPDMAGIVDVVLVLAQESRSSRGYLIFNPGLAVDIEREHGSEAWTIPALPIGESRTPFFLPRQIRITGTGGDLTLTVDWKPYADCVAATTTAALKLDPTPALAATDFARYERRDALTRSVRNAANGQASERKRAGTDLLDFLTSELGPVHPETIEAAVELTEQRNKAEPYDPEAMRTMARAITEHPAATRSVLRVQQAQCQAEADAGVWRDALTSCSKLVAAQAPVLHRLHEDVLEALFSLSHAHARTGDGVTALAAGKDAYLRTVERHGRNSAQAGNAAYTYFLRLFELGRGVEALDLAEQSYEIRLKHYGLNDTRTLEALNAIGVINSSHLARPEIALPIFFQVRDEALRNGVPKDLRQLATVTFNVANTQYRMRLFKEALESSREADRLSRAAFPATARQRYSPTQVQVRALAALGARDEALALARKSLGEAESNLPNDFYTVARAAQLLADQVSGHGSLESLEVWERAYRLGKQGIPRTDVQMIGLIRSYADELDRHGKHADAIEKRHELVESVEALVAQGSALGDARASAFKQWAESYRRLARNLLDEGRSENALEITERAKSRLLLESIALRGAADVVQMTLEERAQLSRLRDQLQRADLRLAASEASSRTIVEIERNRVARELDAHVKALRSRYPRFGKLTEIQPASSEAAQAVLPPRAVLVNFVVGERDLLLFAIARDRPLVAIRRELPPGLRESVNAYRLALLPPEQREGYELWLLGNGSFVASTRRPDAAASAVRDAQLIGHWLAQHLLNPIAAILRDHEHWIISPDSELAHLPFEALPWNGGRVVDQKQVSTTQSVSVYVLGRQSANVTRGSTGGLSSASRWLGLGAPDYAVLNLGLNAEAAAAPRVSGLRSVRQQATLRSEFAPLPNAREELQLVAKSFKQPTLIVGAAATEERLRQLDKSGDLSRFQILHLAAHGFVHPQQPSLSAVVLGADGTPGTDGDGFVTASEWIGLTLSSELIVLSACETALGPTVSGEGVLGLPYALFVAGNRNAVLTLWSVADHATSLFMRQFFTRVVKGHSAAGALSATKRDFARGRFGTRYREPFFWAPFVFVGPD